MGGYVYKWKPTEITLNQNSFSINDIGVILNCNFRKAKEIKLDIIKWLGKKGINCPNTRSSRIDRIYFIEYIEIHYSKQLPTKTDIIANNQYTKTKEEILNQIFMNSRDVRMLLDCPIWMAQKICNDVRNIMINKGIEILLDHVLTNYVIQYFIENDILY